MYSTSPERSNTTLFVKKGGRISFQHSVFLTRFQDGWENEKGDIVTKKTDTKKIKIETFLSIPPKC
jgi:hypothetical protein